MRDLELKLLQWPTPHLMEEELAFLIGGTPDSRYSKVKRLIAQGYLLHIKRGVYCISKKMGYPKLPNHFPLSHLIYRLSYISLESALSYHGLIPEAVYTTTSATGKRSCTFTTPLGVFCYQTVPVSCLYTGVDRVEENGYVFLMAQPWKAICDYVYCYKKDWVNKHPLIHSLRIEEDELPLLSAEIAAELDMYYQCKRVSIFLKGVQAG